MRGVPCVEKVFLIAKSSITLSPNTVDVTCIPDFTDPSLRIPEGYQGYLDPAPDGVDARFAWDGFEGNATGITVVDMEFAFLPTHVDLPNVSLDGALYPTTDRATDHGTAVLGVIGGVDNGFGVTGIAHGADLRFAPHGDALDRRDLVDTVTRAISNIGPGDVILAEIATAGPNRPADPAPGERSGFVPISVRKEVHDVLSVAIAGGITVCLGGGNSGEDLDSAVYSNSPGWPSGQSPFSPASDNGAIIVGAGDPPSDREQGTNRTAIRTPLHQALRLRTLEATIDLQGWGFFVSSQPAMDSIQMLSG